MKKVTIVIFIVGCLWIARSCKNDSDVYTVLDRPPKDELQNYRFLGLKSINGKLFLAGCRRNKEAKATFDTTAVIWIRDLAGSWISHDFGTGCVMQLVLLDNHYIAFHVRNGYAEPTIDTIYSASIENLGNYKLIFRTSHDVAIAQGLFANGKGLLGLGLSSPNLRDGMTQLLIARGESMKWVPLSGARSHSMMGKKVVITYDEQIVVGADDQILWYRSPLDKEPTSIKMRDRIGALSGSGNTVFVTYESSRGVVDVLKNGRLAETYAVSNDDDLRVRDHVYSFGEVLVVPAYYDSSMGFWGVTYRLLVSNNGGKTWYKHKIKNQLGSIEPYGASVHRFYMTTPFEILELDIGALSRELGWFPYF